MLQLLCTRAHTLLHSHVVVRVSSVHPSTKAKNVAQLCWLMGTDCQSQQNKTAQIPCGASATNGTNLAVARFLADRERRMGWGSSCRHWRTLESWKLLIKIQNFRCCCWSIFGKCVSTHSYCYSKSACALDIVIRCRSLLLLLVATDDDALLTGHDCIVTMMMWMCRTNVSHLYFHFAWKTGENSSPSAFIARSAEIAISILICWTWNAILNIVPTRCITAQWEFNDVRVIWWTIAISRYLMSFTYLGNLTE